MKIFLKRALIFFTPVIIIVALWEYRLSTIPNSYSYKRDQLNAQAAHVKVLVLGPSFSLYGVNPSYFSAKGYNAANIMQSLYYDDKITLKYLDKMTSLKCVLINISYVSLWYQIDKTQESWRGYFYADYWGIRSPGIKGYDIRIYSNILHYGPYKAAILALKGYRGSHVKGYCDNGWAFMSDPRNRLNTAMDTFVNEQGNHSNPEILKLNIGYLRELLAALHNRNINAIFFTTPVDSAYRIGFDKSKIRIIDSVLNKLSNEYQCSRFDYTADKRFTVEDFNGATHLNVTGATKFSKIINTDILEPLANSQQK